MARFIKLVAFVSETVSRRWIFYGLMGILVLAGEPVFAIDSAGLIVEQRCRSGESRCGEGRGDTHEKARAAARTDLTSQINVLISTNVSNKIVETETHIESEFKSESVLQTVMVLERLSYHDFEEEDGIFRTIAHISEEAFQIGLRNQRDRIRALISEARSAADNGHLDDVLRLGYWAFLLSHTVDSLHVEWEDVEMDDPRFAIREGISRIIGDIEISAKPAVPEGDVIGVPIEVSFRGQPARLDFELYTGAGMDFIHVNRGRGYIELHWDSKSWKEATQELSPRIRYAYESKTQHFADLFSLHEMFGSKKFDTYLNLLVEFPFVSASVEEVPKPLSAPGSTKTDVDIQQEEIVRKKFNDVRSVPIPHTIGVLAKTESTDYFLKILSGFTKDGRLVVYKRRPTESGKALFVAIADEEKIKGLYGVGDGQFVEVTSGAVFKEGDLPALVGSYRIWIRVIDDN